MRILPLLLFLLSTSIVCVAQSKLEGTLLDAESGDPIPFGTVALLQNGVLVTGAETDFDGYYSITEIEPGLYDIEFSTTGYKPKKVENFRIEGVASVRLNMQFRPGFENNALWFCNLGVTPIIELDNTTQGRTFRLDEIGIRLFGNFTTN